MVKMAMANSSSCITENEFEYEFKVCHCQQDDLLDDPVDIPARIELLFLIRVEYNFLLQRALNGERLKLRSYVYPIHLDGPVVLAEGELSNIMLACLLLLRLPEAFRDELVIHMSNFANSMAMDPQNVGRRILQMSVSIGIISMQQQHEDDENAAFARAIRRVPTPFLACKRSVNFDAMHNFKMSETPPQSPGTTADLCAICLDELSAGLEITRLPCLHIYHHNCIHVWLKYSKSCPTCRLILPTGFQLSSLNLVSLSK